MIIPDFITWTENGKEYKQVSANYKRSLLAETAKQYNLKTFVETGTCEGDTLEYLKDKFDLLISVELDKELAQKAKERFYGDTRVWPMQGDSGLFMPDLLNLFDGPALFWLDAHGPNWKGPIVQELESIFATDKKGVILIDDMDYITDTLPVDTRWKRTEEYGIVRLVNVD